MIKTIKDSLDRLKGYCESENFKGWDPYDGLESKFFKSLPLINKSNFFKLAWIQFFKRNPINFRKLAGIDKGLNPKGLGLFLSGYCKLYKIEKRPEYLEIIKGLVDKINELKTEGFSGACWGYNFDWQSKAFFQPKYTPTIVVSTFIANALLDAYEILNDRSILNKAISVTNFILKDLKRTYDDNDNFVFSYSPFDNTQVFNASLLGSRYLARIFQYINDKTIIDEAKKSVQFCVNHQKEDGSWTYSTLPFHQWIDNFHTGFNLECIYEYQKFSGDNSYNEIIEKGTEYYLNTFFTKEGIPKYFNNSIYPVDVHASAQLVITLSKIGILKKNINIVNKVLNWTIKNMQSKRGCFYYQKRKGYTVKIPYMRWSQAWMFYGLTEYLYNIN